MGTLAALSTAPALGQRHARQIGHQGAGLVEARGAALDHQEVEHGDGLPGAERVEGGTLGLAAAIGHACGGVAVTALGGGITALQPPLARAPPGEPLTVDGFEGQGSEGLGAPGLPRSAGARGCGGSISGGGAGSTGWRGGDVGFSAPGEFGLGGLDGLFHLNGQTAEEVLVLGDGGQVDGGPPVGVLLAVLSLDRQRAVELEDAGGVEGGGVHLGRRGREARAELAQQGGGVPGGQGDLVVGGGHQGDQQVVAVAAVSQQGLDLAFAEPGADALGHAQGLGLLVVGGGAPTGATLGVHVHHHEGVGQDVPVLGRGPHAPEALADEPGPGVHGLQAEVDVGLAHPRVVTAGDARAGAAPGGLQGVDDLLELLGADQGRPHAASGALPQDADLGAATQAGVPVEHPGEEGAQLADHRS